MIGVFRTILKSIRDLYASRELLYMITWREVRIKYKQSIMGFLWALLLPILVIAAGMLVKYLLAKISGKPVVGREIMGVAIKGLPWSFFSASIRFSTISLTANTNLVTKLNFPKEVFPLAAVLSNLVDFIVAAVFLAAILAFTNMGISPQALWVLPLVVLLVLLAAGLGLLLSAANLFFRDVKYLAELVVTYAIFITPVFFDADIFGKWSHLVLLNPVAPILEALNATVVLHQPPDLEWVGYSAGVTALVFVAAIYVFKKLQPLFAESI